MTGDDANKSVIIALPQYGFDPSEAAIPWKTLVNAGLKVTFATPNGQPGTADRTILTGEGMPGVLKKSLMAVPEAIAAYREMEQSPGFQNSISYEQVQVEAFDGLLVPGGMTKACGRFLNLPLSKEWWPTSLITVSPSLPFVTACFCWHEAVHLRTPSVLAAQFFGAVKPLA